MSVEVNIVGRRCGAENGGLSCVYCYLPLDARTNDPLPKVNHEAIHRVVEAQGATKERGGFLLFGGEPLLAKTEDLELLWSWGLEKFGKNGVQTSGRPITEEHIRLFKKYKVAVGFSIDGPGDLNSPRFAGLQTREATEHSIKMLERCLGEKIPTGLIITLHRKNASAAQLPKLLDWFTHLDSLGLTGVNLHLMELDGPVKWLALNEDENFEALKAIYEHGLESQNIQWNLFKDMLSLLRGADRWKWKDGTDGGVSCVWTSCDPWVTDSVRGVDSDGKPSLCQRVHKDGISRLPARRGPFLRQLSLRVTPYDQGGCQGCKFFMMCKGQCPGHAIDGDWRNRSRDCRTWYRMFEYLEQKLVAVGEKPISRRSDREKLEEKMATAWMKGVNVYIADVLKETASTTQAPSDHTDHTDHWDFSGILKGGERVSD